MNQATFHFLGSLNDFMPERQKGTEFPCSFNSGQSVKHLIESLGVPHIEVGRILANGMDVDFSYQACEGDRITIHPLSADDTQLTSIEEALFVLDNHLGRLAGYLRMLGFDALYRNDLQDAELAEIAEAQGRILLTRDRRLLMRKQVQRGYCVRDKTPRRQAVEVVVRFGLAGCVVPFLRCIRCNGLLQPVSKQAVLERLEPLTKQYFEEFRICPDCEQIYWQGSHYERMADFIEHIRRAAGELGDIGKGMSAYN